MGGFTRNRQVMVLADGFSWNGKTYRSLSKVAFAMTGIRWSGPRFFGLYKPSSEGRRCRRGRVAHVTALDHDRLRIFGQGTW